MGKKVVVRHFHDGNDPDFATRGTAIYATQARVVDLETGTYENDEYWSFCSPRDNPSRRLGRHIALERLFFEHPEYRPTKEPVSVGG